MTVGDILYFETDQAIGYDSRWKYHVYLGDGNFRLQGRVFFFINKLNSGACFEILKKDYQFFPLERSYICCTDLLAYSDGELKASKPQYKGRLTDEHLKALCYHAMNCGTFTGWQEKLIYERLKGKL